MFKSITTASVICISMLCACNNNGDSGTKNGDSTTTTTMGPVLNQLNDQEKADGWQLLFNGQDLDGWHKYGGESVGSAWKVSDGAIYMDTSSKANGKVEGGGDLTTNDEYDNFDLKLEWKISPNGNSGIIFYVKEDSVKYKHPYETGPEMQVLDNAGHPDAKIIKHRAGDLYDLISCSKETVRPAGEWNQAEVKCLNGKLDLYLNGETVVTTTLWDDNWKQMVANSKFKQWADFGTFKKGHICLQDHDNMVSYRNIMIKKL